MLRLPWEVPRRTCWPRAFLESVSLFISRPEVAWERTGTRGGWEKPLTFAVLVAAIVALFNAAVAVLTFSSVLSLIPAGVVLPVSLAHIEFLLVGGYLLLTPLFCFVSILVSSAVLHLFLYLVGGLSGSTSGYEGTLRSVAYSSAAQLANLIPLVGWIIGLVWRFYLNIRGLVRMHGTSPGRAATAIVLPGVILIIVVFVAAVLVIEHFAHLLGNVPLS